MFYAKSKRKNGSQPTVTEHLDAVSAHAALYGDQVGLTEEARIAGLVHDFGKYSSSFQALLRGDANPVDHAASSAALLHHLWTLKDRKPHSAKKAVIEAVNGHHGGLTGYGTLKNLLEDSLSGRPYLTVNDGKTPSLSGRDEYQSAFGHFRKDHPAERFQLPKWSLPADSDNLDTMLETRMLLSCLVDADYSVSAWEDDHAYFENTKAPKLDADDCLSRLYQFCDSLRRSSASNAGVNQIRDQVFERCGESGAQSESGLFTLTAPTGTGKTLALLHFALRHAKATGKQRIIIVLPFLTLAEQNAAIYEKIMPAVLVDHSQSRQSEEMREFVSKWNMPFIITTSVKFFESLFACRPTDCRKLHNLAHSVVIFDEAQSLPPHLTSTTLKAVNALCERYQMTMVFSTATQPSFDAIPDVRWNPREILPEHSIYYSQLRRAEVDWKLETRISLAETADEMLTGHNVCGIFNLRRHAGEVFDRLYEKEAKSAFLISTDLCPAHRLRVVEEIRSRQKQKQPCHVAATQCIEAGVDLDFDVLYRALAPLDAIIQAAGRCNRNGNHSIGQVIVFEPDDRRLYPDDWYHNAAELVKRLNLVNRIDLNDPNDINLYYRQLFTEAKDRPELTKAIQNRDYAQVDAQYRLISNAGEKLIVPYSDMMEQYLAIREELLNRGITPGLMKESAPLTVTVFDYGNLEQFAEPILFRRNLHSEGIRSGYWLLRPQYENCYTDHSGLRLPDSGTAKGSFDFCY